MIPSISTDYRRGGSFPVVALRFSRANLRTFQNLETESVERQAVEGLARRV